MARPRKEIDEALVRSLAEIQCTHEEIAHVCGCSVDTLTRRGYADLIKRAAEGGKTSLRRWQWDKASKGDTAMLIWLGKQMLGQKDQKHDTGNTTQRVIVEYGQDQATAPADSVDG